jgi:diamine N-acetyltransferase
MECRTIGPIMTPIHLRTTTEKDLPFVISAERAKDQRAFVGQWTREQHETALSHLDMRHLIIERLDDQTPVGYIILAGLKNPNQSIEFRRIVVTEKGKGYGKCALRLVKRLAFEHLNAHRLWLDVKDHNTRARHVYESEGFVVEGTLRECFKVGDTFESLVVMSMLRREYEQEGRKKGERYERNDGILRLGLPNMPDLSGNQGERPGRTGENEGRDRPTV